MTIPTNHPGTTEDSPTTQQPPRPEQNQTQPGPTQKPQKRYEQPRPPLNAKGRTAWRAIIAVGLCLTLGVSLVAGGWMVVQLLFTHVQKDEVAFTPTKDSVVVSGANANIKVVPTDGKGFIRYEVAGNGDAPKIKTEATDEKDLVDISIDPHKTSTVGRAEVTVGMPQSADRNLEVNWKQGGVHVNDGVYGDVNLSCKSCSLDYDSTAKNVTLDSSSGFTSASGEAQNFTSRTTSGALDAEDLKVTGVVDIHARSGAVTYEMSDEVQPSSINVKGQSGWVDVKLQRPEDLPNGHPYMIFADTKNGPSDIAVDSDPSDPNAIPVKVSTGSGGLNIDYVD